MFITEYLNPPYDEGIKKTVYNLYVDLNKRYELKVMSRNAFENEKIIIVHTNALFLSASVRKEIKAFNPEVIIYFPFASGTFASYLRHNVLNLFANKAKSVLIALQPKDLKAWQKTIIKFIRPKYALTPSPKLKEFWDEIGIPNKMFPLLTDLNIFKPLSNPVNKKILREKYGLPQDAYIISHMGHLNEGRNLKSLIPLQKAGYQVVVIGSSSTPKDSIGPANLKDDLLASGIIILDGYIEHIEEVYQLSDLYIFPVIAKTGSIGMPLSIMEARACGIPVVTTDFGSLKHYLNDDNNSIWYSQPEDFLSVVSKIRRDQPKDFVKTKVPRINQEFYSIIHSAIEDPN
jgi:glycosyltransferase involved in cell wall biosynthesis